MKAEEYLVERIRELEAGLRDRDAKLDAAKRLIGETVTKIAVESEPDGTRSLRFHTPTYVPSVYERSDPLGFERWRETAAVLDLLVDETEKEG